MEHIRKKTPAGWLGIDVEDGMMVHCHWMGDAEEESISENSANESKGLCLWITEEIDSYFAGQLRAFTMPIRMDGREFEKKVWEELMKVPYGKTVTYGEIARRVGKPGGARAVGMACKRNPIAIIVPCHRIVAAGGKRGGYNGGTDKKDFLLCLESDSVKSKIL